MKIIPAIDIKNGKCVRLIQGDYGRETIYDDNPIDIAKKWASQGAKLLNLIDLDGAKAGKLINFETIENIVKSISIPIQVGGGIRTLLSMGKVLDLGVSKIILGTAFLDDENFIDKAMETFGNKIVISLDVKNGLLMKNGWIEETEKLVLPILKRLEKKGVRSIIYTDTEKDGTLMGPNYDVIQSIRMETTMEITIAGGISSVEQIMKLKTMGVDGVVVGKALYEGKINLKEVINYAN